jgi:hypothetical protein
MDSETELNKKKPECESCAESFYSDINVGIPVTITPFGKAGCAKTQCLESNVIFDDSENYSPSSESFCSFIIMQKLRVEIPVSFGAKVEVDDAFIKCAGVDSETC